MSTVPDVRFKAGYFKAEQFPSWAAQSFEWLTEGSAGTTLSKEEDASDTTLGRAFFSGILENWASNDFQGYAEGDLITITVFGITVWAQVTHGEQSGDTSFFFGFAVVPIIL
jgi:hypothetical protein